MAQPFTLQFQVTSQEHQMLLREFLLQKNISRKALTDIKADGELLVNDQPENVQYIISYEREK